MSENGRPSKRTVAEALLLRLVQSALKGGDIRAIARALDLYERFADKADDREDEAPSEQDLDILRRALHGADPDRGSDADGGDDEADNEPEDETGDEPDDDTDEHPDPTGREP